MKKDASKLRGRKNPTVKNNAPPAPVGAKVLFIAAAAAAAAAFVRSIPGFFPVLQGMSAGIGAGWASGLILKKSSPPPGERAWLWMNAFLAYTLVLGILLDFMMAIPFSPPFSWLGDVLRGGESEVFFGAPIFSRGLYGGALSGAGWIFFNALDGIFFFFSGLITLGLPAGGGAFTVEMSGYGSLALRSEPENSYYISISKQGRHFRGRLYRGKSLERVFLKFSEGGRVLIAARRKSAGARLKDLIVEAGREEKNRPGNDKNYTEEPQ